MSEANKRTISTYNDGVQAYIDGTPQSVTGNQKLWIDMAFSDVDTTAKILEVGSGFGRDSRYLMELGYAPELSDGTPAFVDYLREQGFKAEQLDIVNDRPKDIYDVIFASAVFLHFTDEDFDKAVTHVHDALKERGKFIFSLKKGEGDKWSNEKMGNERYFHYWDLDRVVNRIGVLGLAIVDDQTFETDDWLYLAARKI